MNRLLPTLLLPVLLLASCTVYRDYPIEVYRPGEVTVPDEIENVTLVYRNFKYTGDTLQHFYKDNYRLLKASNDPENLDSILVSACIGRLAGSLERNKTFESIKILPYNTFEPHTSGEIPEMSPALIQKIGNLSSSGWIISLETLSWFFSAYPEDYEYPETNEVITVAVWSVYDVARSRLIDRINIIDTVIWNGYDNEGNYNSTFRLPSRIDALKTACAKAGDKYAKRFYGSWETVNRIYSVPPLPDFSDAAFYFEEGKVDMAIDIWIKYTPEKNGKLAINAMYNLALAYEMKDEIPVAQNWLTKALELAESYRSRNDIIMIRDYLQLLKRRQAELGKLIEQVLL
jgi:tetratricopeptide (TPR) repeat protein